MTLRPLEQKLDINSGYPGKSRVDVEHFLVDPTRVDRVDPGFPGINPGGPWKVLPGDIDPGRPTSTWVDVGLPGSVSDFRVRHLDFPTSVPGVAKNCNL